MKIGTVPLGHERSAARSLLGFFAGLQPAMAIFWLGLAIFTVGLGVLLYTRWGQYRPLRKCMVLSLLAHLMLACYAATIQIVMPVRAPAEPIIHLSIGDGPTEKGVGGAGTLLGTTKDQPWEVFPDGAAERPDPTELGAGRPIRPASLSVWFARMPRGFQVIPCWTPWPWRTRNRCPQERRQRKQRPVPCPAMRRWRSRRRRPSAATPWRP